MFNPRIIAFVYLQEFHNVDMNVYKLLPGALKEMVITEDGGLKMLIRL